MSTVTANRPASFFLFVGTSGGASPDASLIPDYIRDLISRYKVSATGNLRLDEPTQAIYEVYRTCSQKNWNGEQAEPISENAAKEAERLLLALPSHIPVPDIFSDPTGAIAFEWYRRPKHRLVISFYGNGTPEFAGLLGAGNEVYGQARIGSGLPSIIQDHLRQLFSD